MYLSVRGYANFVIPHVWPATGDWWFVNRDRWFVIRELGLARRGRREGVGGSGAAVRAGGYLAILMAISYFSFRLKLAR